MNTELAMAQADFVERADIGTSYCNRLVRMAEKGNSFDFRLQLVKVIHIAIGEAGQVNCYLKKVKQ